MLGLRKPIFKTKIIRFEKSHNAENCKRRALWDFFNIHSVAKFQKIEARLLLGGPQIILINLYAKCQKLRQVLEVGQLPEVATATNSDYATCGLKRESCRAEKKHPHFPITLAYRKCNKCKIEWKETVSFLIIWLWKWPTLKKARKVFKNYQ